MTSIALGAPPLDLDVGDVDGDGHVDLVVDGVEFLGDGTGAFEVPELPTRPEAFAAASVADVDGDGSADLVISHAHFAFSDDDDVREVSLRTGSGESRTLATNLYPGASVIGDFDGDGAADLAVQVDGGDTQSCGIEAFVDVMGEAEHSSFGPGAAVSVCQVWAAPIDGGTGDEVLVQDRLEVAQVASFDGAAFGEPTPLVAEGTGLLYARAHALGDVDCDGDLDAVVAGEQGLWLATNDGSLPWVLAWDEPLPVQGNAVSLADLDGDGRLDAALATDAGVHLVSDVGAGEASSGVELPAAEPWLSVLVLDANEDGRPDLAGRTADGIELILSGE